MERPIERTICKHPTDMYIYNIAKITFQWTKDELAADVLQWKPIHRKRSPARQSKTYIDQVVDDTHCRLNELTSAM